MGTVVNLALLYGGSLETTLAVPLRTQINQIFGTRSFIYFSFVASRIFLILSIFILSSSSTSWFSSDSSAGATRINKMLNFTKIMLHFFQGEGDFISFSYSPPPHKIKLITTIVFEIQGNSRFITLNLEKSYIIVDEISDG